MVDSIWTCAVCATAFVPCGRRARYCSHACYERAQYLRDRERPEHVAEDRARSRAWREANRVYHNACCALRKRGLLTDEARAALQVLKGRAAVPEDEVRTLLRRLDLRRPAPSSDPEVWIEDGPTVWERSSPAPSHLPVTAVLLHGPLPQRWHPAYAYRLFGALSRALRVPHRSDQPTHGVVHDRGGWWAQLYAEALPRAPQSFVLVTQGRGSYREERITLDPLRHRLRAPAAVAAGQYRVRVSLHTPLVVRAASRTDERHVRTDDLVDLRGSLAALSRRLDVPHHESELHATIVARDTERVEMALGGHLHRIAARGRGEGLLGTLTVECNAPALWLLRAAVLVGLGSDTARGFGRLRLEDA